MEDKRKDLVSTHQKEIVSEVVEILNTSHPSFYYMATTEIAYEIQKYIRTDGNLTRDKYEISKDLSREDIQILLSFHNA